MDPAAHERPDERELLSGRDCLRPREVSRLVDAEPSGVEPEQAQDRGQEQDEDQGIAQPPAGGGVTGPSCSSAFDSAVFTSASLS